MKIYFQRLFFKLMRKSPDQMEMVQYWKRNEKVQAKLMKSKDGSTLMQMEGEKYAFPGFPRGHLLYGKLSKLKHELKNQVFNDAWRKLDEGVSEIEVGEEVRKYVLPRIFPIMEEQRFDIVPPQRMCAPVREIHRAWTKACPSPKSLKLRDIVCHILQEDDAYRFRFQWLVLFFNPNRWYMRFWGDPVEQLDTAMVWLENAEVIGDMKERMRLLRRVTGTLLHESVWRENFLKLCREIDFKKVLITERDKFFFRGKWFRVDLDKFEY